MQSLIDSSSGRDRATRRAFSLIEILITITVIAVIAGIAIPIITNVFHRGQDNAARRNAQSIAGVASSATAAGSTAIALAPDKETAVDLLAAGINGEGQFAENVFMVKVPERDREKTLRYLEFEDGQLAFDPGSE
jgi:prepilin-type N-terminal cleavage/methylation domain-containing protein